MGKGFGQAMQLFGAVLSFVPGIGPFIGIPLMIGGGLWAQHQARKDAEEAMAFARRQRAGIKGNTRETERAIPVVYGNTRIGGNALYIITGGPRADTDFPRRGTIVTNPELHQPNIDLHMILGVSEGPIESFEGVWFNDVKVWEAQSGMTQVGCGFLDTPLRPWIDLDFRLGCNSQDYFHQINSVSDLGYDIAGKWTSDVDKLFSDSYPHTAVAYVKARYNRDDPQFQQIPVVTFDVLGKRVRDLSVSLNTVQYSNNPVNVLFDMMTNPIYGWGLPSSKIDIQSFIDAATFVDRAIDTSAVMTTVIDTGFMTPYPYTDRFDATPSAAALNFAVGTPEARHQSTWVKSVVHFPLTSQGVSYITFDMDCIQDVLAGEVYPKFRYFYYEDKVKLWWANSPYGITSPSTWPIDVGSIDLATGSVYMSTSHTFVGYGSRSGQPCTGERKVYALWYHGWGARYYPLPQNWIADSPVITLDGSDEVLTRGEFVAAYDNDRIKNSYVPLISNSPGGWGMVSKGTGQAQVCFSVASWGGDATVEYQREGHRGYSFNGPILDAAPAIDTLRNIMTHFRGYLVYGQGIYRLQIDKSGSATYYFDEDNIKAGTFNVSQAPISDRPNRIKVKYTNAADNYIASDVTYEVPNAIIPVTDVINEHILSLLNLNTVEEAFRMAKTLGEQSKLGTSCEFITGQDGLEVEPGDIVAVTHSSVGWVDKAMRVVATEEYPDETIKINAVEHDNAVYEDEYT